jgi:1,4-alpha-glucan branching enzyme
MKIVEFYSKELTIPKSLIIYPTSMDDLPEIKDIKLTDYDLYLLGQGTYYRIYDKMGAHVCISGGKEGANFSVWAPNAKRVGVVGDFNLWDGNKNPMQHLGDSGIWSLFIPGVAIGDRYKFEIRTRGDDSLLKSDPLAFQSELRPKSASVVCKLDGYTWQDGSWLKKRDAGDWLRKPVSIYEVHLGSWRRKGDQFLTYRELAESLIPCIKEMGFTHVEILPVAEHPLDASWGYQVIGYFSLTSRYGAPQDFMFFVDQCHQNGIGVILDWVPAHFPRDYHALGLFDGTHLYEHMDPRKGEHKEWGTRVFNYGRNEVKAFLVSNALFWFERYHVDGLRNDAVSSMLYLDYDRKEGEWIANRYGGRENLEAMALLREVNTMVYEKYPGAMMIAEESSAWPAVSRPVYTGGLGFGFKWNMGWMHDTLEYMSLDPVHRKYHHRNLTFGLLYAFSENFILPLSHDEVVHGKGSLLSKMSGDRWQKFANLRAYLGFMFGHPGKKLLFMGGESGQWNEWYHEVALDWNLLNEPLHRALAQWIKDLNATYTSEQALHSQDHQPEGFEWIDPDDSDNSVTSFIRWDVERRNFVVVLCNFTPVIRYNYMVGIPEPGLYQEILNSDSYIYGGSNVGNLGGVGSDAISSHGRPFSLSLTLPPLAALFLKKRAE